MGLRLTSGGGPSANVAVHLKPALPYQLQELTIEDDLRLAAKIDS
jgi:hypothetical protein